MTNNETWGNKRSVVLLLEVSTFGHFAHLVTSKKGLYLTWHYCIAGSLKVPACMRTDVKRSMRVHNGAHAASALHPRPDILGRLLNHCTVLRHLSCTNAQLT